MAGYGNHGDGDARAETRNFKTGQPFRRSEPSASRRTSRAEPAPSSFLCMAGSTENAEQAQGGQSLTPVPGWSQGPYCLRCLEETGGWFRCREGARRGRWATALRCTGSSGGAGTGSVCGTSSQTRMSFERPRWRAGHGLSASVLVSCRNVFGSSTWPQFNPKSPRLLHGDVPSSTWVGIFLDSGLFSL